MVKSLGKHQTAEHLLLAKVQWCVEKRGKTFCHLEEPLHHTFERKPMYTRPHSGASVISSLDHSVQSLVLQVTLATWSILFYSHCEQLHI